LGSNSGNESRISTNITKRAFSIAGLQELEEIKAKNVELRRLL